MPTYSKGFSHILMLLIVLRVPSRELPSEAGLSTVAMELVQ